MEQGTRVIVNGVEGFTVKPNSTSRGRHGAFDPRREVLVKVGRRVKCYRKGDVEGAVVSNDVLDKKVTRRSFFL
jgi:hypothetical protein